MLEPDLDGRVALVTGSARGIGRELLRSLADHGASVVVHYHTSDETARGVAETVREAGGSAMTVGADVTDPDAVDSLFDAVEAEFGSVDVLVNNVGDFAPVHWTEIDWRTWNRVLATNFNATCLCAKRALGPMREAGWGRIVNVGYASAGKGLVSPENFPYFVAKTGVVMFTRMLAADTQDDGITVNAVSPYVVENSETFPETLPRGRPARFEDLQQALLFFVDEDSGYVSGENVEVDGGWLPETV